MGHPSEAIAIPESHTTGELDGETVNGDFIKGDRMRESFPHVSPLPHFSQKGA